MSTAPHAGTCANCIYRRLVRDVGARCCRHAPVVVVTEGGIESVFPAPPPDSWCGDHVARGGQVEAHA